REEVSDGLGHRPFACQVGYVRSGLLEQRSVRGGRRKPTQHGHDTQDACRALHLATVMPFFGALRLFSSQEYSLIRISRRQGKVRSVVHGWVKWSGSSMVTRLRSSTPPHLLVNLVMCSVTVSFRPCDRASSSICVRSLK